MARTTMYSELAARSQQKFTLSQARLRRDMGELALLSLRGSLEDGLRSHLLLHQHPAAHATWPALLTALAADERRPLMPDERAHLDRVEPHCTHLSQGDPITLPRPMLISYQQLVAALLVRYGVLVVAPPSVDLPDMQPRASLADLPALRGTWWERNHQRMVAWGLSLSLLVLIVLASASALAVSRDMPVRTVIDEPGLLLATSTPAAIVTGMAAVVQGGTAGDDVPLYTEPARSSPVALYVHPGTTVEVVSGPAQQAGTTWWQVRIANQQGWAPAGLLSAP